MSFLGSIIAEVKASAAAPATAHADAIPSGTGAPKEATGSLLRESAGTVFGDSSLAPLMAPDALSSSVPAFRDTSSPGAAHPPAAPGRMAVTVPSIESPLEPIAPVIVKEGNSTRGAYRDGEQPVVEIVPVTDSVQRAVLVATAPPEADPLSLSATWGEEAPIDESARNEHPPLTPIPVHAQAQAPLVQPGEPFSPQDLRSPPVAMTEKEPVPFAVGRQTNAPRPTITTSNTVMSDRTQAPAVAPIGSPVTVDNAKVKEIFLGEPPALTATSTPPRPNERAAGSRPLPRAETADTHRDAPRETSASSPSLPATPDVPLRAPQAPVRQKVRPTPVEIQAPSEPVESEPLPVVTAKPANGAAPPQTGGAHSAGRAAPSPVAAPMPTRVLAKATVALERPLSAAVTPQAKPAPRAPEVRIGQVDIFIEAPKKPVASDRAASKGAGALSSRLYLRRI